MQVNLYYKCNICTSVCNLKYQKGFSKRHPIRYKCSCGVVIRGVFQSDVGITFDNATKVNDSTFPDFVVHSSGEFLTIPPYRVKSAKDTMLPTSFILATQMMNYEDFRMEFTKIIDYRDNRHSLIRAINDLYYANNIDLLISTIDNNFNKFGMLFPLKNKADILRAVTMINQFQFLDYDGTNQTLLTAELYKSTYIDHVQEVNNFIDFLSNLNYIPEWKRRINTICDQVYEKIDLITPAIGIDFYKKGKEDILSGALAITTTSFEDIKQLYVDLYELICSLLIIVIGFDNIILRNDHNAIQQIKEVNVKTLDDVSRMRNKGNIIKLINAEDPFESFICKCLNSNIRNSIGHFSYKSEEIAGSYGQTIRFYDFNNSTKYADQSLVQICYDIWQMYKCLGIFNELIHHIELRTLANEGVFLSFIEDKNVMTKMYPFSKKKIYPNEPCPCGSGQKYKKCCCKNI